MKTITLLVKTEYFMDKIKNNPIHLENYVIDYADYSSFILEQLKKYRYRKFHSCILGQENPNEVNRLISVCNFFSFFYCNEQSNIIKVDELEKIHAHPELYAIVIYNCYN